MFFKKLFSVFSKQRDEETALKAKITNFLVLNRDSIKILMNTLQVIYQKGKGRDKMQRVVETVCSAVGAEKIGKIYSDEIVAFVEDKCQKIYEELLAEGQLK